MTALSQLTRRFQRGSALVRKVASQPRVAFRTAQFLFVFSHMRSRSTLLSHVLGSHPEISGYLETHIHYKGKLDFISLRVKVSEALGGEPLARYVMDKVLHNWYISPMLAKRMNVQPIFLVRAPEETLRSLCNIMKKPKPDQVVQSAVNYYIKRLNWLENCCRKLSNRGVFIESTGFLQNTAPALELLQEHLKLATPLSEQYQIFDKTGRPVFGDPSEMIKKGEIIRDGRTSYDNAPPIPQTLQDQARFAYDACVKLMKERCSHV